MTIHKNWLPRAHDKKVEMGRAWVVVLEENRVLWDIPTERVASLKDRVETLADAQEIVKSAKATDADRVQRNRFSDELDEVMRDIKKRWIYSPPLLKEHYTRMMLAIPSEGGHRPIAFPDAQATADRAFPGPNMMELVNIRVLGEHSADPRADHGVRIHFGILNAVNSKWRITEPPQTGADLPYSEWTRKPKIKFDFDGEAGNEVFFSLQFENAKGEAGPYCPVFSGIIPR